MSTDELIEQVNNTGADFFVTSLSARKGQEWLLRNRDRLTIPVRAHLGATLNYQAGTVRRAPEMLQRTGLEWIWRIKEERYLWRRYWRDGWALLRLFAFRALPLLLDRVLHKRSSTDFSVVHSESDGVVTLKIHGSATKDSTTQLIPMMCEAVDSCRDVVVDLSCASSIDARIFGLLVVLRKSLRSCGCALKIIADNSRIRRLFKLNGFEFLLLDAT